MKTTRKILSRIVLPLLGGMLGAFLLGGCIDEKDTTPKHLPNLTDKLKNEQYYEK